MPFFHYLGGVAADQATGRPLMGVVVRVMDDETNAPVQAFVEGDERTLVTGAHGLIQPFQTEDSTRRVRLEVGPVRLRQWAIEITGAAGEAITELERLTISHVAVDTEGRLFFSPGSTEVRLSRDSAGRIIAERL